MFFFGGGKKVFKFSLVFFPLPLFCVRIMARLVGFLNAAPYRTALVPTGRNVTGHRRCRSKASSRVLVCRASSSSASSSDENGTKGKGREESANWKEELRVLLDRDTSMDTRGILLFDLLKQSPEIAEDLYKEAKENSGLEGISPVVNQVVTDILPEIQREGPALASKVTRRNFLLPLSQKYWNA